MNWLAHLFLSPGHIDFQLGNLLTDLSKGRIDEIFIGNQEQIESRHQGWQLHITIDEFTDAHPVFNHSKSRLGSSGRLRGVVVDLVYDHFLTVLWKNYSRIDLQSFLSQFYRAVEEIPDLHQFPDWALNFLDYLRQSRRLASYHNLPEITKVMSQLDGRIRHHYPNIGKREKLINYYPLLDDFVYRGLREDFLVFFPEVMDLVAGKIGKPGFWHFKS